MVFAEDAEKHMRTIMDLCSTKLKLSLEDAGEILFQLGCQMKGASCFDKHEVTASANIFKMDVYRQMLTGFSNNQQETEQ